MTARAHLTVRGTVQGVGFRWFARDLAIRLGLTGWVRNLPGGEVEAEAQGEKSALEEFVAGLREGPPGAAVDSLARKELPPRPDEDTFDIVR